MAVGECMATMGKFFFEKGLDGSKKKRIFAKILNFVNHEKNSTIPVSFELFICLWTEYDSRLDTSLQWDNGQNDSQKLWRRCMCGVYGIEFR